MPLRYSLKKECYPSSIEPPSPSLTFIIGNQYLGRYSVSFEYSLPVQNSEDLKSVIAQFISLLVRNLATRCSFGNKPPFLCEHPLDFFTVHLSQDCSRWKSHIKSWQPEEYYKRKQRKLSNKETNKQKNNNNKKYDFKVNGIIFCGMTIVRHEIRYMKLRDFSGERVLNSCCKLIFSNYFYLYWVLLVT